MIILPHSTLTGHASSYQTLSMHTFSDMASITTLSKLFVVLALACASVWGCETEADCSLLGECVSGKCVCDPGWKGHKCGQVDLLPAFRNGGYRNATLSTWGGYSIKIGDKCTCLHRECPTSAPLKSLPPIQ